MKPESKRIRKNPSDEADQERVVNSRRTIILLVAVVVGALAAFGLLNYVRGVENAATEDQQLLEVWVVNEPIPRGTPAQQVIDTNLLVQKEVPVEFRPATAIVDPQAELVGLVAVTDLPPNSVLVNGNFVSPSVVATGITDRLEERGMVTVTFSLDQINAAAYLIEAGDYVNILAKVGLDEEEQADAVGADGEQAPEAAASSSSVYTEDIRYLYQRVEVLAVDKQLTADLGDDAAGDEPASANAGLITLAVPPDAVQRILGIGTQNIYLSIVPSDYVPEAIPPLDLDAESATLPGEDDGFLTPYGPEGLVEDSASISDDEQDTAEPADQEEAGGADDEEGAGQ